MILIWGLFWSRQLRGLPSTDDYFYYSHEKFCTLVVKKYKFQPIISISFVLTQPTFVQGRNVIKCMRPQPTIVASGQPKREHFPTFLYKHVHSSPRQNATKWKKQRVLYWMNGRRNRDDTPVPVRLTELDIWFCLQPRVTFLWLYNHIHVGTVTVGSYITQTS